MTEQRDEYKFLGRLLGTGAGWDGDLGECWQICDFIPARGVDLPAIDPLGINEVSGYFESYDLDGNSKNLYDIVELLNTLPRT